MDSAQQLFWYDDPMWYTLEEAIAQGHEFTFYVVMGSRYRTGKIIFTGLPMMSVNATKELADGTINCRMDVFDPFSGTNGEYKITRSYAYYEPRGKTSLIFPKRGYNLHLYTESGKKNKQSLLGMRTDDDWKLNALYSDKSKLREMLAIKLWSEIASTTEAPYDKGTDQEYMELMLNSEYQGIYGLMERIDFKQLSLDKERDVLFKGVDFISEENLDGNSFEDRTEYGGQEIKYVHQKITEDLWRPMIEYLEITALPAFLGEEPDSEKLLAYIEAHMDLENLLNLELFLQAIYAEDNAYKNQYTAAVTDDSGNYRLWKMPWDLNFSFGDCYKYEEETLTVFDVNTTTKIMKKYMLTETLLADDDNTQFAEALNKQWHILRKNSLSKEHVKDLSEQYLELLTTSGAFARDLAKWHQNANEASFDEALTYLENRLEYLDAYYESFLR